MKERLLKVLSFPLALMLIFPVVVIIPLQWIFTGKNSIEEVMMKYMDWLDDYDSNPTNQ
jgi:hypothetical protein